MSDNLDEPDYDWITADGTKLKYSEMGTSHIKNCIAMLERKLAERPDEYAYGEPDGDFAQDAFHQEIAHNDQVEESIQQTIKELEEELKKRG